MLAGGGAGAAVLVSTGACCAGAGFVCTVEGGGDGCGVVVAPGFGATGVLVEPWLKASMITALRASTAAAAARTSTKGRRYQAVPAGRDSSGTGCCSNRRSGRA